MKDDKYGVAPAMGYTKIGVPTEPLNSALWLLESAQTIADDYTIDKSDMETRLMQLSGFIFAVNKLLQEY